MLKFIEELEESQAALAEFEADLLKDNATAEDLELLHLRVSNLMTTIRTEGVCRNDIGILNELGFIEAEEKYFSEYRTTIGADVALEAEGKTDWKSMVLAGVLTALTALLSFIVGKFLGWLFASRESLSDGSRGAQQRTEVNITKNTSVKSIEVETIKKMTGSYQNVIALHKLGNEYLDGAVIKKLNDAASDAVKELTARIDGFEATKEIEKIIGDKPVQEVDRQKSEYFKVSPITEDLIKSTYDHLVKIMGKRLTGIEVKTVTDDSISDKGNMKLRSGQVGQFRGNEIFSEDLIKGVKSIEIILDKNSLDPGLSQAEQKELESEQKKLESVIKKHAKTADAPGWFTGKDKRARISVVNYYRNQQIVYPAQYINTLYRVILALSKAVMVYQTVQVKMQVEASKLFSKAQIEKIGKLVGQSAMSDGDKRANKDALKDLASADIEEAIKTLGKVLTALEADTKITKDNLKNIRYYTTVGKDKLGKITADELYSVITEVKK